MFIADAQAHVWLDNSPERRWSAKPHKGPTLTVERLMGEMKTAGVSRVVLVPPSWDDNRNDLVLKASTEHPDLFRAMGRLDLDQPDALDKVATWTEQPGMLGIRASFNRMPWLPQLADGRAEKFFAKAEKADLPIMLMVTHQQIPLIDSMVERHPGLRLALCHCSFSGSRKGEEALRDFPMLLPIAKRPNVMVKVSALPAYAADDYPYRSMHEVVRRVYDAFGPRRMFWGTDLSHLPCSYRQAVTMFTEEMPFLSADDLDWIMGRGVCEWLRWQAEKAA